MLRLALTVLLLAATPAVAEQFKIRCERDDYYYVGFDLEKKTAFWKARHGMMYRGEIFSVSDEEIVFGVSLGNPIEPNGLFKRRERVFMFKREGQWEPTWLVNCVPTQDGSDFDDG